MSIKHSIVKFKFEDFAGLAEERGTTVRSQIITDCHGNKWRLSLYPRGNKSVDDIALALYYEGTINEVSARATFIVRDASGGEYVYTTLQDIHNFTSESGWGADVIKRSDILDKEKNILVGGALHVDIHIQIQPDSLVVPPSPHTENMLRLLDDAENDADVQFKVNRTVIKAHKLILKTNAPILYEFSKDSKEGEIQIKNVKPEIFRIVLRYIYADDVPGAKTIQKYGKDIINAADRFGVVSLKLVIETELVRNLVINRNNVTGYLIFAESKTCSLLKEAAMSYFVARATDLLNSETWKNLSEAPNLMAELMKEMSKRNDTDSRFGNVNNLPVNDLRKKLIEEELDIDGSKEMLVSRLTESAKKRQRTE